jgi:hypothetical protein
MGTGGSPTWVVSLLLPWSSLDWMMNSVGSPTVWVTRPGPAAVVTLALVGPGTMTTDQGLPTMGWGPAPGVTTLTTAATSLPAVMPARLTARVGTLPSAIAKVNW